MNPHTHEVQLGPYGGNSVISSEPVYVGSSPKYQAVYDLLRALEETRDAITERGEIATKLNITENKLKKWQEAEGEIPEIAQALVRLELIHESRAECIGIMDVLRHFHELVNLCERRMDTIGCVRQERDALQERVWDLQEQIDDLRRMIAERESD